MVCPPCFLNGRFVRNTWSSSRVSSQAVLPGMAFMALGRISRSRGGSLGGSRQHWPNCSFKTPLPLLLLSLSLSDCSLREPPSFPFPVSSESKVALLQPSLLPKYSPERTFSGTFLFPPSYLISPGYPALAVLLGSGCPPHPPPSRGCSWARNHTSPLHPSEEPCSSFQLPPLPLARSSPALVLRTPVQLVLRDRHITQGLVSREPSCNRLSHGLPQGSSWD